VSLDIQFEVSVVAGPPASWGVAIVERYHTTPAAAGRAQEGAGNLSMISCGKPFTLEIEALDVNHNRWAHTVAKLTVNGWARTVAKLTVYACSLCNRE
jgi:hypothetical protein